MKPTWRKTTKASDCSVCGWKTSTVVPHYATGVGGGYDTHHCTVCHRLNHNWHRAGDSEGAPVLSHHGTKAGRTL
jgi:hypothetical protein